MGRVVPLAGAPASEPRRRLGEQHRSLPTLGTLGVAPSPSVPARALPWVKGSTRALNRSTV
jgi:hypothetical protein